MKISRFVFFTAAAVLLSSCVREDLNETAAGVPVRPVSVYADFVNGSDDRADTKVVFDEDIDGKVVHVGWKESGETFTGLAGTSSSSCFTFIQKEAPEGGRAMFAASIPADADPAATLYAIYPEIPAASASAREIPLDLGVQDGSTYSGKHTYMYASCMVGDLNPSSGSLRFKHLLSIMKIGLDFPEEFAGKKVSSVKVKSPNLISAGSVDLTGAGPAVSKTASTGSVTLSHSEGYDLDPQGDASVYMHFFPTEITGFTVEARVGDDLYVANIPARSGDKAVEAGRQYYFNLTGWTRVEDESKVYYVSPGGTGTGLDDWSNAASLSSVLGKVSDGATVYMMNGTYYPDTDIAGYAKSDGTTPESSNKTKGWEISKNITIVGGFPSSDGSKATVLDGRGESYHVLFVAAPQAEGGKVILKNLTVTKGNCSNGGFLLKRDMLNDYYAAHKGATITDSQGSGIVMLCSVVEMENVVVTANKGQNFAVFAHCSDVKMTGCTVSDNICDTGAGAMFRSTGNYYDKVTLEDCLIKGNQANSQGGLCVMNSGGTVDFIARNCEITSNKAKYGAAIQCLGVNVTLESCLISKNNGFGGNGVICTEDKGTTKHPTNIVIKDSSIEENYWQTNGAGMYLYQNSATAAEINLLVMNSSFISNNADQRGLYLRNIDAANRMTATFINTTFHGNNAQRGPVIDFHTKNAGTIIADLISCTATANNIKADYSAINAETSGVVLNTYNTIISGNLRADGTDGAQIGVEGGKSLTQKHISSIIGNQYYNASGTGAASAFDYGTMFDTKAVKVGNTQVVKLVGASSDDNPAIGNGASLSALQSSAEGSEMKTYVSNDQTGTARSDSYKVMGAYVGGLTSGGPVTVAGTRITVMSYNIRLGTKSESNSANNWDNRKPASPAMAKNQNPTVFGLQEAVSNQVKYMADNLSEYGWYGVGRDSGSYPIFTGDGEVMAIFYKKSEVTLGDHGTFWLADGAPTKPAYGWDAACRRTATWAIFTHNASNKQFLYINTHLDHEGREAQEKSILLLIEQAKTLNPDNLPLVITGDFNIEPSNAFLKPMQEAMKDVRVYAPVTDYKKTYNAWGGSSARIIDHIYCSGFIPVKYETVTKQYENVKYVSDHYPLMATLEF